MNTLVVYESQFGNTKHIAEVIVRALESRGPTRVESIGSYAPDHLRGVDLLIVGGPTQGHGMTPQMRHFAAGLESQPLNIPAVAFDTRVKGPVFLWGSAGRDISSKLRAGGFRIVAEPESFLVTLTKEPALCEGEDDHARAWSQGLATALEASPQPAAL